MWSGWYMVIKINAKLLWSTGSTSQTQHDNLSMGILEYASLKKSNDKMISDKTLLTLRGYLNAFGVKRSLIFIQNFGKNQQ